MTGDGVVFFGLLIGSAMWIGKRIRGQMRALEKGANSSISGISDRVRDMLHQSGYAIVHGPRSFPVTYDLENRQVEQSVNMDGVVERDRKRYVLVVESDSTSARQTSFLWRDEWHAFHVAFPELAGVLVVNPTSEKVIKIQVE